MKVAAHGFALGLVFAVLSLVTAAESRADPIDRLIERMDRLEEENRLLRWELETLKAKGADHAPPLRSSTG